MIKCTRQFPSFPWKHCNHSPLFAGEGSNRGNFGTGVRASISKPTPFNTWPSKKRTHSYTWSSKMLTYSYTALWFFVPIFCWLNYTNIIVNSCNTKSISSLEKSLSEKYVHVPGCQKNGAFHIGIQKNGAIHILFVEKKGQSYTWQCWKRGLFGTHIRTPSPPLPPREKSVKLYTKLNLLTLTFQALDNTIQRTLSSCSSFSFWDS